MDSVSNRHFLPAVRDVAARFEGVHQIVGYVATACPDATALRHGDRTLSYHGLDSRARALAVHLIRRGARPGSIIAVCLDRSIEQIIATLAVLYAGCAYLALDPADPAARRRALAADSGVAAVVTTDAHRADFPETPVISHDDANDMELLETTGLPPARREDLAYIVYTSGSTGVPNGVEITHGNLINFLVWTDEAFNVTPEDVASHAIGLTFDVAASEIWPYLAAGATITLVDETVRTSPELMRQWLLEEGVTIATIPMTMAELMLKMDWPCDAAVRLMLTGGDVLRAYPRSELPFDLVNNYGPSECTIVATFCMVPRRDAPVDTTLPSIGRPITGAAIYLLDEHQNPVADGEEGEIWIGGAGVGRGYRGKPELTAARFVADPFASSVGARMYRTGDRGRWLATGELAFCGRIDSQTKIRGVRIELDEVALALQRHPGVGSAVVVAREDPGRDRYLAAYIIPAGPIAPTPPDLQEFLAQVLPRPYLPAAFVMVDAMPLTRNAKVDYAALPMPDALDAGGMGKRMPETPTERRVAMIVEAVLGTSPVGADDDFFLLGGHSILATQVVVQSREVFGVELTLRDLFAAPTVAGLAATIEDRILEQITRVPTGGATTMIGETAR
jgi:amino acid adenylation domain-containing protein